MKTLFNKIKKNQKRINQIKEQIENVKTMPYYSIFGNVNEREKDLKSCKEAMQAQLDERQVLLENLSIEINKQLCTISEHQRNLKIAI